MRWKVAAILFASILALACSQPAVSLAGGWGAGSHSYYPFYGELYGVPWYPYAYRIGSWSNVPAPPYFAVHPPVYYGRRVGMPYGNSPLVRPPRPVVRVSRTAARPKPVRGVMIENPYVSNPRRGKARKKGKPRRAGMRTAEPETIANPYVAQNGPG